ncbi:MAG: DUF4065 domain-containing protein [Verrucomicrobiaceae bacterium]|nr:MAG: DUF4065 domain-containing protein [Verrucomicrobiaceae bacterium]
MSDNALERLAAAVHYVIVATGDHDLGKTKLNKILWFADCAAWRKHGRTVTGLSEYTKLQYGPVPPRVDVALNMLQTNRSVEPVTQIVGPYVRYNYRALAPFRQTNYIGLQEREILDDIIEAVKPMSAFDVSELSHDALWHATPYGQKIAVSAAAVQFTAPDQRIREWAQTHRH